MKILAFILLLTSEPDTAFLKDCANSIVTEIATSEQFNDEDLAIAFEAKTKLKLHESTELSFNVVEHRLGLKVRGKFFSALVWTYNNKVFRAACFIDDRIFGESITKISIASNEIQSDLTNDFINHFQQSFDPTDLDPDLDNFESISSIGYACSLTGNMPPRGNELLDILRTGNETELLKWTVSLKADKRIYGLIGLRAIEHTNVNEVEQLLQRDSTTVTPCAGCLYGPDMTISEFIRTSSFEQLVKDYTYDLKHKD